VLGFCAVVASLQGQTWTADNGNGTYTNPLFFDEFSDPDLIRVGDDYYMTGTTMHSMPGLPILHSRDLVNWQFVAYAAEKLDLGPSFRLEEGKNEYGRGIWAPCFRYHQGVFYIFSNVNGQTTQVFRATNPKGPWTRTAMKRSLHDLSVLFDDDGKIWVVWGYQGLRIAQLTNDLSDLVPGTERELMPKSAGMGEGVHFYKIRGKYFLTSAWFLDEMRMPTARADRLEGPWEVNQNVSRGEDFGLGVGYRVQGRTPPFRIVPPDASRTGRNAIHQGGIVETPAGEWWGFSMMDANSVGRLTALSPVTWSEGWPYFGLPGNLGRSPRTWVKPKAPPGKVIAPYRRSDDFSGRQLQAVWQWNHVPVNGKWSLEERPGYFRLHAQEAVDLWSAKNTLTQRAMGPRSMVTAVLDTSGMKAGDTAGLALFNRPYAWLGVERGNAETTVTLLDEATGTTSRERYAGARIWLRANCDFMKNEATFQFSLDGKEFRPIGKSHPMVFTLTTFQGVRYSLFAYHAPGIGGGHADFDAIEVREEAKAKIPLGKTIGLQSAMEGTGFMLDDAAEFKVVDRSLGRVALQSAKGYLSVLADGKLSLRKAAPTQAETFQWMETFDGQLLLLSLRTNRYLRREPGSGAIRADAPGPHPDGKDGVRWVWKTTAR
jgi:beta-xylosidase